MNTIRRLPSRKMSANGSDQKRGTQTCGDTNNDIKGVLDYEEGNVFNEIWITKSSKTPARKIQTSSDLHRGAKNTYSNSK